MVSCEIDKPAILRRDGFQKAQSLAEGPSPGDGCSPGRGADPWSQAWVATQPDDESRDVSAYEYRRGMRSAEHTRVFPLSADRTQLDYGTRVPPCRRSRPCSRPRRLANTHKPGDRSKKDALRPSSLSQISLRGRKRSSANGNDSGLIDFPRISNLCFCHLASL